jgi:hypothetical protein
LDPPQTFIKICLYEFFFVVYDLCFVFHFSILYIKANVLSVCLSVCVFITNTCPLDLLATRSNNPLICGPRWLCERRIRAMPRIWARGQKKQRSISHARTVSSSNALSSHAHGDPPINPREQEDLWLRLGFGNFDLLLLAIAAARIPDEISP